MSRTVLTLMAHPDDAEILCGGTLVLLAQAGWKVHIATTANGDCGTPNRSREEIAAIRREERRRAAAVIGGESHGLELGDLLVFYDERGVRLANSLVRRVRPDIVITHSPTDYMLDHEETSKLARAACFNAPIPNAPLDLEDPEAPDIEPADDIPSLFYADPVEGVDPFGEPVARDFVVDIAGAIETKLEMLTEHASQREWLRAHHGMDEYLDATRRWSALVGEAAGVTYAEGFRQHKGHAYPRENVLKAALGERVIEAK